MFTFYQLVDYKGVNHAYASSEAEGGDVSPSHTVSDFEFPIIGTTVRDWVMVVSSFIVAKFYLVNVIVTVISTAEDVMSYLKPSVLSWSLRTL